MTVNVNALQNAACSSANNAVFDQQCWINHLKWSTWPLHKAIHWRLQLSTQWCQETAMLRSFHILRHENFKTLTWSIKHLVQSDTNFNHASSPYVDSFILPWYIWWWSLTENSTLSKNYNWDRWGNDPLMSSDDRWEVSDLGHDTTSDHWDTFNMALRTSSPADTSAMDSTTTAKKAIRQK